MHTKKILILVLAIVPLFFAYIYISTHVYSSQRNKIISVKIKDQVFRTEVVSSAEKMQKGLGGREKLCQKCGMLFEFSLPGKHSFWMKNMQFPLDIVWILNHRIVHMEKNVQTDFAGTLISPSDADAVLEINAGSSDEMSLKIGDSVGY